MIFRSSVTGRDKVLRFPGWGRALAHMPTDKSQSAAGQFYQRSDLLSIRTQGLDGIRTPHMTSAVAK